MAYIVKVNGVEVKHKNRVALKIIEEFINKHKNESFDYFDNRLNKQNFSSTKVIIDEKEKNSFISQKGEQEFKIRYFWYIFWYIKKI